MSDTDTGVAGTAMAYRKQDIDDLLPICLHFVDDLMDFRPRCHFDALYPFC
jgi:hypothetical protein